MRATAPFWLVLLVAGVAAPQEAKTPEPPPSPYAAMGFPVTFNEEIITANDVARFLGDIPLDQIDATTLRRNRDLLLLRKINERIAADLNIEVGPEEMAELMRRQIDHYQGEAKFYEYLAQQGMTLERFRNEQRQMIIDQLLRILFTNGVSHDHRQLLPWRVGPTPREVEIAFKNDPAQREGAARVRRLGFKVGADQQVRAALSRQVAEGDLSAAEAAEEIDKDIRPRVDAALEALGKGKPFADVAREHGVRDVEAMAREWQTLGGITEADKFLAVAKPGEWSQPIRLTSGEYEIVLLVERSDPSERKVTDPAVADEYGRRIRSLRATKWENFLRLRALNDSTVEPPRVREDLRKLILASLKEAEDALRALGLR
jgi:parvulin-like peptidyl-prolyl isomerase